MRTCLDLAGLGFPVKLEQQGVDRFTVTYGKQVVRNLDYRGAAAEFGECVMHALACDGLLDNRTKAQARRGG